MKYRKRPVVVNAVLYDGTNVVKFAGQENVQQFATGEPMVLRTLEGHRLVTGLAGEVYPVKPDIFLKTYEPAELTDHDADFATELRTLLNRYSKENESDTPDYVLRDFLINALMAFDLAVAERERWYGR